MIKIPFKKLFKAFNPVIDGADSRDFNQCIDFSNYFRMTAVMIAAVICCSLFFAVRLWLYSDYGNAPGYLIYVFLNGIVTVSSSILLFFFRKYQPDSPQSITKKHQLLIYASAGFAMILLSVSSGVEYIGAGTFSRFLFAIFGVCVVVTLNWFILLIFYIFSSLTILITVHVLGGNLETLIVTHMHIPIVMVITWMISRVLYVSASKDYLIRKKMEVTNLYLQEEIKARLKTVDELTLSEMRFRALFENAPDAYILYDIRDDIILEVNPYAESLVNLRNRDIAGKSYRKIPFLTKDQTYQLQHIILETIENRLAGPYEFDLSLIGKPLVIELRSAFATLKGRDLIIGLARDITGRKETEKALKQSYEDLENRVKERTAKLEEANELLRQEIAEHTRTESVLRKTEEQSKVLIEKMNDGFAVFDKEMTITYANDRLCKMLGYPRNRILGHTVDTFITEDSLADIGDKFFRNPDIERESYEIVLKKHDGNSITTIISPEPLYSDNGTFEGSFSVITDITRIKEMETALRESEEMSRAILDASNDSVMMLKPDGKILASNETAGLTLNEDPGALTGKNVFDYLPRGGNDFRKRRLLQATESGDPAIYEDIIGDSYYAFHLYPINDGGESIERVAVFARDITELKNAEKHIHSLTQELIKVQESERQRISRDLHDNVAQDLATLKIGCDTLFDIHPDLPRDLYRKVASFSRILQKSIMSIRDLAYDLRPPGLDQLGLVTTIGRFCDDFSDRYLIRVDYYSAGVSELKLNFDTEINLYRIIQEALNNIYKHAEASLVTIRLTASFPTIILRIEDDGIGFDIKKRLYESLSEKRMGVRSIKERAALLQGKAKINSIEMQGTKIVVEVPIEGNVRT